MEGTEGLNRAVLENHSNAKRRGFVMHCWVYTGHPLQTSLEAFLVQRFGRLCMLLSQHLCLSWYACSSRRIYKAASLILIPQVLPGCSSCYVSRP